VKLPAHRAGLRGQRSGEQGASKGNFILIVPLGPPIPLWRERALAGQASEEFKKFAWVK